MNILLTSVGRRTYLVDYFQDVLRPIGGKVFAFNSDADSPALWRADVGVEAPLIYDEHYPTFLLQFCLKHQIKAVISLFDIELPILSRLKAQFLKEDIKIIVADEWVTTMANDKWLTQQFLQENGFNTVAAFIELDEAKLAINENKLSFPLYVKPRWGMGSLAIHRADNLEELIFFYNRTQKEIAGSYLKYESQQELSRAVIIQESMPGIEYGLDVINDLDGNYCTTIVKHKLAMRSGETDGAVIVNEPTLNELGQKLAELTRHPGNMDLDVFLDPGKSIYVLELNPRFGGGYPFSHAAGVNLPEAIIKWLRNENVDPNVLLTPIFGLKAMKGISLVVKKKA